MSERIPHLLFPRGATVFVAYAYEVRKVTIRSIMLWREYPPKYCVEPVDGKEMLLKDFDEHYVFATPEEAMVERDEQIREMREAMVR
jgi:hypothetical protein